MSCLNNPVEYSISPHAYLSRARDQLINGSAQSLFYAAFELRCFVESRQDQYLDAQREYVRSVPRMWKIGAQGKALSKIFESDKIQHISWYVNNVLVHEAYHTPVTMVLRNRAEKLGKLLHAQGQWRAPEEDWWQEIRNDLLETYELAWLCSRGTLLSPMFLVDGNAVGRLAIEIDAIKQMPNLLKEGAKGILNVDYPDTLPENWQSDLKNSSGGC